MSDPDHTVRQLQQLASRLFAGRFSTSGLTARTPLFVGGLDLNSFAVVELIVAMEDDFGVRFDESDFREENFRNLQTLADLINLRRTTPGV